jgi:NAD(P)-dependent dehydrogenase (short-subunit alcohol dehydrogenase family)
MPITTTVITGATSGIGKETAIALAKKGHAVYMLVRDTEKGEQVKQQIIKATKNQNKSIYVIGCDLADLQSVREAAQILKSGLLSINVLINNAGGIFGQYQESPNGHEMTFAVNHLGHFLLVQALLPQLQRGQARIINVSSNVHRMAKPQLKDINWKKEKYSPYKAYAISKLYNIYFTRSLAIKYGRTGISSFAVHPGWVNTSFGSALTGYAKTLLWLMQPFMITPEDGAQTTIFLATAPRIDARSGKYFKNREVAKPSSTATEDAPRNELWDISMNMIAPFI